MNFKPRRNRMNNHRPRPSYVLISTCREIIVRGNAVQIAEKYEKLAADARGDGDLVLEQLYLNHVEHWRKGHQE